MMLDWESHRSILLIEVPVPLTRCPAIGPTPAAIPASSAGHCSTRARVSCQPPPFPQRYLVGRRLGVVIRAAGTAASFPEPLGAVVNAGAVQPASKAARCARVGVPALTRWSSPDANSPVVLAGHRAEVRRKKSLKSALNLFK
jgi:hypothetical protein